MKIHPDIKLSVAVKLAKLALYCLEDKEREFRMKCYFSSRRINESVVSLYPHQVTQCGTSCCLLGYAPLALPELLVRTQWPAVFFDLIEDPRSSFLGHPIYRRLFDEKYEDDREQAAARVYRLLKTGGNDDPNDYLNLPWSEYRKKQLKKISKININS